MKDMESPPEQYRIDYLNVLQSYQQTAQLTPVGALAALSNHWMKAYKSLVGRQTSIYEIPHDGFCYMFDCEGSDHCDGLGPQPPLTMPRVVAAYGVSKQPSRVRGHDDRRMRGWVGPTQLVLGKGRDKGHFVAHSMGGAVDTVEVNVFAQNRALNRGWSSAGKIYRKMEKWCAEHPGTVFFHRALYIQESDVPDWLEFGIIHDDFSIWCELFDNRVSTVC